MTIKALITLPTSDQQPGPSVEDTKMSELGLSIEFRTKRGALVRLKDKNQAAEIEALGYHVTFLPETNILRVGDYTLEIDHDPTKVRPEVPPELEVPDSLVGSWVHHLVQLSTPPTEEETGLIEKQGVQVIEPISVYGLFVVAEAGQLETVQRLPFVAWTGPFKPAYRVPLRLLQLKGAISYLSIGIYPSEEVLRIEEILKSAAATIVGRSRPPAGYTHDYCRIIAKVDARLVPELARQPGVRWLEFASSKPGLDGEREAQITAMNVDDKNAPVPGYQKWLTSNGLSGKDVVIAICDTGVSDNAENNTKGRGHDDLRGRQVGFKDYTGVRNPGRDPIGHGTLVASIAVGDGKTAKRDTAIAVPGALCGGGDQFLCGQGIAPGAGYFTQNALLKGDWPPSDFGSLTTDAVTGGAHIMNNSWNDLGLVGSGYTDHARRFDQLVRDPTGTGKNLDSLILIFSAGNGGPQPATLSSPHEAKNIIVVGSSLTFLPGIGDGTTPDDINGVHQNSSRGPAADGRTLPNVVAPGNNVSGASSEGLRDYIRNTGTSLAASVVAGSCALLVEWWCRNVNSRRPSPAMMKAMLINGAEDLAGGPDGDFGNDHKPKKTIAHIPNNVQGWGRINLTNIITGKKLFFDQDHEFTATGQEHIFRVKSIKGKPLRITLVWTDAPGAVHCSPELVNDLNLKVTEISTDNVFRGNVFDPATGFSRTGGEPDTINNIECVYIERPVGAYEITVSAETLKMSARPPFDMTPWQDFALVVANAEMLQ